VAALACLFTATRANTPGLPVIVNTWPFVSATEAAWRALQGTDGHLAALDAVEQV